MQHDGCEEIQLLISRLIDDEVSPGERARVEQHIAICDACACKMLEYMEMAVLFSETPLRQPDPDLRSSLFREIGNLKDESRLKEEAASRAKERPWFLPTPSASAGKGAAPTTLLGRLFQAASPFAVAATALFVFLGALLVGNKLFPDATTQVTQDIPAPHYLPTRPAPIDVSSNADGVPGPIETKVELASASPAAPTAATNTYMQATVTLGHDAMVQLAQPTPVLEDGDAASTASWHTLQDPQYGYRISYPPNWWTQVVDGVRYFYPWTAGGTGNAPYWVEMIVSANLGHYTADNSNQQMCNGKCETVRFAGGQAIWLRRKNPGVEGGNSYDEAYMFDAAHIYQFRVMVPMGVAAGAADFQSRMNEADNVIFAGMSGKLVLAGDQSAGNSSFGSVLFLNGADLWLAGGAGIGAFRVTTGYKVRQFAQSPDLNTIAFTANPEIESNSGDSKSRSDPWARGIYLTHISSNGPATPALLLSNVDVHDIAWYSDHELLALAQDTGGALALYKLVLPKTKSGTPAADIEVRVVPLVVLTSDLSGAGSLAVSPDRQLITFLAPMGLQEGTDIYAVRPDGTDLMKLVSHGDPISLVGGNAVRSADNQAIKSYVWADGHLEKDGYQVNILFTCGNSYGPYSYPGGLLFSTASASHNPLLDPMNLLRDSGKADNMQIIHIAYSSQGKVALTGYLTNEAARADQLAGLWTADLSDGNLLNVQQQPLPQAPDGVTDLEWSPDGTSLIYRETIPALDNIVSSQYDGGADFQMVKLDIGTGKSTVLYDGERH